jgi:hypothetical protein
MKKKIPKIKINLMNSARVLIILYILFITLFSFDTSFGIGFFIHLIPTAIFLATLIFTWKKPKLAGILFVLEGFGTIIVFNTYRDLFVLFTISFIPILAGILFLIFKGKK